MGEKVTMSNFGGGGNEMTKYETNLQQFNSKLPMEKRSSLNAFIVAIQTINHKKEAVL